MRIKYKAFENFKYFLSAHECNSINFLKSDLLYDTLILHISRHKTTIVCYIIWMHISISLRSELQFLRSIFLKTFLCVLAVSVISTFKELFWQRKFFFSATDFQKQYRDFLLLLLRKYTQNVKSESLNDRCCFCLPVCHSQFTSKI